MGDSPTPQRRKPRRVYTKHGLTQLLKAVSKRGLAGIDGRSSLAVAARTFREHLMADLGGADEISTGQATLIELAARSWVILERIDAWLFAQPTIVNARRRCLLPIVVQRQTAADALAKYVTALGLERRKAPPKDLHAYLAEAAAANDAGSPPGTRQSAPAVATTVALSPDAQEAP